MRDISCDILPIRDHAFFEQAVLQRRLGQRLLELARLCPQSFHLVGGGLTGRVAGETPLARFQELLRPLPSTPSPSRNTCSAQYLLCGRARRCWSRRATLPGQHESYLRLNTAAGSPGECPVPSSRRCQFLRLVLSSLPPST